eukprot:gb/GFBE01023627.1/.p1 GENE.gb/GFBE01023627.1/~~gb/GFBE01023627.1/.p1  ORF type:complete len:328 (+),score=44.06 gb/GFBE01023627.1/:1-984(+)
MPTPPLPPPVSASEKRLLAPWEPWEWPKVFGTSPKMKPRAYLAFRVFMVLIFVAHLVAHLVSRIITEGIGARYFIYLDNWCFILETVLMVFMLLADVLSIGELPVSYEDEVKPLPSPMRVTVALFSVAQPLSFVVTVLYWTLENPVWKMSAEELPDYLGFFAHGIDLVLMIINFVVSRVPYSCWNSGWLLLFGAVYLAWTRLHYELNIGTPRGCQEYIRPECPVYSVIDWHRPKDAAIAGACFLFVALPLCIALFLAIAVCRDNSDEKTDLMELEADARHQASQELLQKKSEEAEQAREAREVTTLRQATDEEKMSMTRWGCLRCGV